ncbi:ALI_HP2_G0008290.mRNA.1.CDS.1 [Saccharomyces cerevisiae]|nr:ALI_HP2_G0008290.mRNA.1.CDS.1 [Saccharomyces cerevisiae]CAI6422218.1 ALI_HP2_G0008290.mRNA.1.CDS.1 [Saccharomyces cerevisiae]CAI6427096.1 ALI_HP1_G0008780.mRNA.1.CDS.1 [Saccharomyces cerevisiae]
MLIVLFLTLFCSVVFRTAYCDVAIVAPEPNSVYDLSGTSQAVVKIKWMHTDNTPQEKDFVRYTFTLCSGTNAMIEAMATLQTLSASDLTDSEFNAIIENTVGTDGVYFIQVFAQTAIGYTIHYTNRFKLKGMIGTKAANPSMITIAPEAQTRITTGDVGATIDSKSFTVPYNLQTGVVKYAPMQLQPATKVTAKTWKRKYATSEVTYYYTLRNSVDQHTTVTPGWSYIITADSNYATPAPMPADNGGWYNPRKRLSLTARKVNALRHR